MYDLSFCVPSIRPNLIPNLYNSIVDNFHKSFELVLCGPYIPEADILSKHNVKFIQDFGSPSRALQIASINAQGKYISVAADDATFLSKSISRAIIKLEKWGETANNYKHVVTGKYVEGNMPWWMMTIETGMKGYTINTAYPKCEYIPDDWIIFNIFYMHREYFNELGGYDCCFELPSLVVTDLAVRAQRDNCTTELMDEPTFVLSHQPGLSGDHLPVHYAQGEHDVPLFSSIYNDVSCLNRIKIQMDNWKNSPEKWNRRFS